MKVKVKTPPLWISIWIAFSTCIVLWDAGYCFLRPRSLPGGDLAWIWWPYNRVPYAEIDLVYGMETYLRGDGFTNAQAFLNLIEATLNVEYLILRHTSPKTMSMGRQDANRPRYHGHAPLVGFASVLMTTAKTSLYFLQEYYCGWCTTKQNTRLRFWQFYIATNGIWWIMPLIVTIVLGRFIANGLNRDVADQIAYSEWDTSSTPHVISSSAKATGVKANGDRSDAPNLRSRGAASSSGYAVPSPGAALPLTFNVDSLPVLVIGSNKLAATRTFTLLEAGARVFILSPKPLNQAHEEVQYRVKEDGVVYYQVDMNEVNQWIMFLKGKKITLVCVTDTLIGLTGSESRGESSMENISKACKSLGIPLNISDHPQLSNFSFPSVYRFPGTAGPSHLQVSISTNGHGCRLGGRIKREVVARLPESVGAAVDNVGKLRALAKSKGSGSGKGKGKQAVEVSEDDPETPLNEPVEQILTSSLVNGVIEELKTGVSQGKGKEKDGDQLRRMRWVNQMSEYYSFEALARMTESEMEEALETWQGVPTPRQPTLPHHDGKISTDTMLYVQPPRKGRILLIGSGPGHPGLLTMAAYHALKSATLILSDKLVPSEILALIPSSTTLHIAKKFPGNNEGAQNELMIQALAAAKEGQVVVRLKQGDPFVYGRGGEEVLYFREHGFEATVIPGVTSAIAGPEMVGIPVTQRGVAESMILCTGVGRAGKAVSLPAYIKSRTLVVLMGVARIQSIVSTLTSKVSEGRDGERYPEHLPIAVIERASSPDQRVIMSTLKDIEAGIKSMEERPPGMMVIGWAVSALQGKGRVDVLDGSVNEKDVVKGWLGGERWIVREGMDEGWSEYLNLPMETTFL